ncbi:MAG: Hdr-like menaquinol oxidoreductase cytochrome c subunit [Betaproteobacteria bacterium]|nr:Hdr-like menaquinol oxidoreductase cytochrome c subunit [Betaproteobacteria bacterium]
MIFAAPVLEASAGVDLPKIEKGKGEKCVEETQFMRRNHMELLKHHRDETMRKGIRTTKHSLKKCVECHASEKTGSVAASKDDFCASCHRYASVKLDCWDCHATKPMKKPIQVAQPSPRMDLAKESVK